MTAFYLRMFLKQIQSIFIEEPHVFFFVLCSLKKSAVVWNATIDGRRLTDQPTGRTINGMV